MVRGSKLPCPPWRIIAEGKRLQNLEKCRAFKKLPKHILEEARERQDISGEFIDSLLDDFTKFITTSEVPALMNMMHHGSLTAVDLTLAFCQRASIGHQLVRALAIPG